MLSCLLLSCYRQCFSRVSCRPSFVILLVLHFFEFFQSTKMSIFFFCDLKLLACSYNPKDCGDVAQFCFIDVRNWLIYLAYLHNRHAATVYFDFNVYLKVGSNDCFPVEVTGKSFHVHCSASLFDLLSLLHFCLFYFTVFFTVFVISGRFVTGYLFEPPKLFFTDSF